MSMYLFPQIFQKPRTGDENLYDGESKLDATVVDFWRWSASDLLSNATRGRLAEFIVALALGVDVKNEVRDEWSSFDLITPEPERIKVEVKSAAFIQSWAQLKHSTISFRVPKTRSWNSDTNIQEKVPRRQADVYVFALLSHKEQETVDPTNLDQWRFYVLPTGILDTRTRSQHSITIRSLEALCDAFHFREVKTQVLKAAERNSTLRTEISPSFGADS